MTTTINASNSGSGGLVQTADASGVLALQTAGTTAVTVDTSQNVGIGTTSPGYKLDVSGAASATPVTNGIARILTTGSNPPTGYGGGLLFTQVNSGGTNQNYASITGSRVDSTANNKVDLVFATGDPTGSIAIAERMRIDTSGNVGIGTTSPSNYGKLAVAGTIAAGTDQTDQVSLLGGGGTSRVEATGGNASVNLSLATKGGGSFYIWRGGYGGTNTLLIDGSSNLQFNSGYGSVATAYGCRAWVMFNGSNGSIFAQGNVSSITRNGVGNYRVNFSTAMPDASFSVVASCSGQGSVNGSTNCILVNASAGGTNVTPTTTTTNLFCYHPGNQVAQDTTFITVAVFR